MIQGDDGDRLQHYMRMNEELDAKISNSVKNVEAVVKESREALEKPLTSAISQLSLDTDDRLPVRSKQPSRAATTGAALRPASAAGGMARHPTLKDGRKEGEVGHVAPHRRRSSVNVTKHTGDRSKSIGVDVSALMANNVANMDFDEEDIGLEATNRLLKAKLAVAKEEIDKMMSTYHMKDTTVAMLEEKVKFFDDERSKIGRNVLTLQNQLDKAKKANEELKKRNDQLEVEVTTLKKELEGVNKAQKQTENDGNSKDLRLNRALEDLEKSKASLAKFHAESKDKLDSLKKNSERLLQDNKKLVKQKGELIAVFKKQNQLIDILKRQKLHIESATLLKFSEEEFVRALNCRPVP
ncbi:Golgin sub A member 2 [Irineochytrium annulatum]|nr:Golgin sub A member 2 [Irineochytrium annulatum]